MNGDYNEPEINIKSNFGGEHKDLKIYFPSVYSHKIFI